MRPRPCAVASWAGRLRSDRVLYLPAPPRVELQPGASERVTLSADRRLLARFDSDVGQWHIAAGTYKVAVGNAADAPLLTAETTLTDALFGN